MKKNNETYLKTDFAEVYYDGALLRVFFKPEKKICVELIKDHFRQVMELTGRKRVAVYFDTGSVSLINIPFEFIRYVAENEYNPYFSACAVVQHSYTMRKLVEMFNAVFTPTLLTEVFDNEEKAMAWLKPHIPVLEQ